MQGGGGNDILNGLAGADVLTGGSGADTFRFDSSAFDGSQDQIADYSYAANDVIDLSVGCLDQQREPLIVCAGRAIVGQHRVC